MAAWTPVITEEAERLRETLGVAQSSNDARAILDLLETAPQMGAVWTELYRMVRDSKYRKTETFKYPAQVTNAAIADGLERRATRLRKRGDQGDATQAKLLEAEASWQRLRPEAVIFADLNAAQNYGLQLFFRKAFDCARFIKPVFKKDVAAEVAKLRSAERALRIQADVLNSMGMNRAAAHLIQIAEDCEDAARIKEVCPKKRDPSIIVRDRRDARARTLVVDLSIEFSVLFGDEFPTLCAHIANAVMKRNDINRKTVQEWLRSPRPRRVKRRKGRS
ncbi:hypothetical protein ACVMFA_007237 [Bradyrhizobium liaoningense]|uniref:hypothetical protein n=1 Tax=Bradyrhizobium liaoningense TaxID=43992 RepID=UPI00235BCC39|nr:hypothetical protein [Bradyrhizobium liaoningense]GLR92471.1 hypothetical protein GCM10007858_00890 [Bradyrhizobium liaoningense]